MEKKLLFLCASAVLLFGCTKDFDGLIVDSFDFTVTAKNDPEGFVYQDLSTTFSINPSREVEGAEFFFDYEIIEGDGYFIDKDGNIYEPGDGALDNLIFEYAYVPTVTGRHNIKFKVTDHRDNLVESVLDYEVEYAPFTALLKGGTNSYVVNRDNDLLLIMLSENTSKELDTTYIVKYSVDGGLGTIYRDTVNLEIGKELKFQKGNSEISYVPTTLGEHIISMVCRSPDGFEKKISHAFEVENITFFVSADVVNSSGTIGDNVDINVVLQTTDVIEEVDYEVVFYFAEDSEGSGTVTDDTGEAVVSATQYPIEPGSHSFTFNSEVIGRKKMYIDISDSNNQIKRDSVIFDYNTRSFEFSGSTPNTDVGLNQAVPINFVLSSEEAIGEFTFSYRRENGNGSLRDNDGNSIEPTTAVPLSEDRFTFFYTATTMGDNDLVFIATDGFGQANEVVLSLDINGDGIGFSIASTRDTYQLEDNADLTFNNGGSESYTVEYSTSNDGIITYKGTSYSPGTSFVVESGVSLGSYQAFVEGDHMLEFGLTSSSGQNITSVLDFTFRENVDAYVTIGSNLGGGFPVVGTGVGVEFNVNGEAAYTAVYSSSNTGSFEYNGSDIAPGDSFTVSAGTSSGIYTGTESGGHELMFDFTSGAGDTSSSGGIITYVDGNGSNVSAVTVGSGTAGNRAEVGSGVKVDFNAIGGGNFTAKYTGNLSGTFVYNGSEVASGESFAVSGNGSSGTYTGAEEGNHKLAFEFTSGDGTVSTGSTTIQYGGASDGDISFTARAASAPVPVSQDVSIDFSLSGNGDFGAIYVNDNSGTLSYNGATLAPGQTFAIQRGTSKAVYNSTEPGNHNLKFTASLSTDESVQQSATVTIKYIEDGPGDSFTVEPIANDSVDLRTETGISLILKGDESYTATFSTNNVGTLVHDEVEVAPGESFVVTSGTTLATYKGTEPGDHLLEFKVTSDTGAAFEDSIVIIFREAAPEQLFFMNGKGLRKVLNEGAEVEFALLGEEDYVARYGSSQDGYLLYRDTYIAPGEIFPISSGESSGTYVGTSDGIHTIEVEVSPFSDFFVSSSAKIRFIYAAIKDFDFTVSAESESAPIGESVIINFFLDQNDGAFIAKYANNNQGTFTYNGFELEPGDGFLMNNGPSNGIYNSSQAGPHKLNFTIVSKSDRYAYAETEIVYEDNENAINFIAGAASSTAGVNDSVDIRFTLRGEETYTATYSTDSSGSFTYNGSIVAPGESFNITIGNSTGTYIGTSSGTHNLEFEVRSDTGIESRSTTTINYN